MPKDAQLGSPEPAASPAQGTPGMQHPEIPKAMLPELRAGRNHSQSSRPKRSGNGLSPAPSGCLRNNRKTTLEGADEERGRGCPLGPQASAGFRRSDGAGMLTLGDICCTNEHLVLEANTLAAKARVLMAGMGEQDKEGKLPWSPLTHTDGDKFLLPLPSGSCAGSWAWEEPLNYRVWGNVTVISPTMISLPGDPAFSGYTCRSPEGDSMEFLSN